MALAGRAMDIDVKKVMLTLLERQKEYVLADLEKYSEAMVAVFSADGQSYIAFPKFQSEASKVAEYTAIVETAKSRDAILMITVNHARRRLNTADAELDDYRWGDFDETNSRTCILLTASGPGLQNCSLELGYAIDDRSVEFDPEPEFLCGIELNLLPDWPGGQPHGFA
jgi:hypothetical protein